MQSREQGEGEIMGEKKLTQEEEPEESHDNSVNCLICNLCVDLPKLCQVSGFSSPHWSCAQTNEDTRLLDKGRKDH